MARPTELDDRDWLAGQYATRSAARIARRLDVNPQMVRAAIKRHEIPMRTQQD